MTQHERGWDLLAKIPTLEERRGESLGFFARRKLKEARAVFEALVEADAGDTDAAWGLARVHHAAGELEEAWALYDALSLSEPRFLMDASLAALALGHADKAEPMARQLAAANATDHDILVHYARCLLIAGHARRALGVVTNVCKHDPDHPGARRTLDAIRKVTHGGESHPSQWQPSD